MVVVAASGNDDMASVAFPAGRPVTVAVGASNRRNQRRESSNYGWRLDLVAPSGYRTTGRNGDFFNFSGTSHAAPVVSGLAGLLLSESRDRGLGLTNDDVMHLMEETADNVDAMDGNFDNEFGHGRVNARTALEALQPPNEIEKGLHAGGSRQKVREDVISIRRNAGGTGSLPDDNYAVEVYEVTGYISFENQYEKPPLVWPREQRTTGWSGAAPNYQVSWAQVTDVTNGGFDFKTFVYDVSHSDGERIGWFPVSPSNVEIAYTAVGERGIKATLSGPSSLDSGEQGTWSASVTGGSGTISYDWSVQPPGSNSVQDPGCSGSECSYTFVNDSDQSQDAVVTVSATRGTDQDGTSMTVTVAPEDPTVITNSVVGQDFVVRGLTARSPEAQTAALTWSTAGPRPASPFVIGHRRDTTAAWTKVGTVDGPTSAKVSGGPEPAYRFEAEGLAIGTHQFRLAYPGSTDASSVVEPWTSDAMTIRIELEAAYRLSTYPNPVHDQATVELAVKESQEVQVRLYDVLGRRVATLHDGPLPAQRTEQIQLDAAAAGISSGQYFVHVYGETFTATRQLTVVQ